MAVLSGATASARQLYGGTLSTTANTVVYTAPIASANVTSPSATAYIKEIILANVTTGSVIVSVSINGLAILAGVTINANDTKILSGLNSMIPAGAACWAWSNTASAVNCLISGVEVQ